MLPSLTYVNMHSNVVGNTRYKVGITNVLLMCTLANTAGSPGLMIHPFKPPATPLQHTRCHNPQRRHIMNDFVTVMFPLAVMNPLMMMVLLMTDDADD